MFDIKRRKWVTLENENFPRGPLADTCVVVCKGMVYCLGGVRKERWDDEEIGSFYATSLSSFWGIISEYEKGLVKKDENEKSEKEQEKVTEENEEKDESEN